MKECSDEKVTTPLEQGDVVAGGAYFVLKDYSFAGQEFGAGSLVKIEDIQVSGKTGQVEPTVKFLVLPDWRVSERGIYTGFGYGFKNGCYICALPMSQFLIMCRKERRRIRLKELKKEDLSLDRACEIIANRALRAADKRGGATEAGVKLALMAAAKIREVPRPAPENVPMSGSWLP